MLQLKLFHSKTATKYVKGAKMAEFIKTCDQYPHKFSFANLSSSFIVSPPLSAGEIDFQKTLNGGHE